jgi:hypothetical protein
VVSRELSELQVNPHSILDGTDSRLIVQVVVIGLAAEGLQVDIRVASPEPAVGVFTPA